MKPLTYVIISLLLAGCGLMGSPTPALEEVNMDISLTSPAFQEGQTIPAEYTCDGENISPALAWGGPPAGTRSFVLIADDPDAPLGTWVHWLVYNIPADARSLPEAVPAAEKLSGGALHGSSSFRRLGYGGPCPPSGTHRYYFKLYALDILLDAEAGLDHKTLLALMDGHILAQGQLMGRYSRQ